MTAKFYTKSPFFYALFFFLLLYCQATFGQGNFNGILINSIDSTFVPYASIHVDEVGINLIADEGGRFSFPAGEDKQALTFTIAAIGCKRTIAYNRAFSDTEKIFVELIPDALDEVTVSGITAKDVMKNVMNAIPRNYMDSSHYAISFYRQYQNVNGTFMNLMEAQPIVYFDIAKKKSRLLVSERYSVDKIRHSSFLKNPGRIYDNYLHILLVQNPIYHLLESSLDTNMQSGFTFRFDTSAKGADYVIDYISPHFSSDHHGVEDYTKHDFSGESWERGKLVIDKKTYAIKKYTRTSIRNPRYNYPNHNNLLQPTYDYYVEFVDGDLEADYVQYEGKWYLKRMVHKYTNEYIQPAKVESDFTITDVFEWYSIGVVSRLEGYDGKFTARMPDRSPLYDPGAWKDEHFPFAFFKRERVYKDLERMGPMSDQFSRESRIK